MSIPFIQQNYLKYHKGKGFISGHVDALHAMPPAADKYTDLIVMKVVNQIGCAGIISTVSRMECDLNRSPNKENQEGIKEYRKTIKDILRFLYLLDAEQTPIMKPYLHLSFHGMKDVHYGPFAIEIGTLRGQSCSPEIKQWFGNLLTKKVNKISSDIQIVFDTKFIGDKSIIFHRLGDGMDYTGYGDHFHTFQIELSRTLRRKYYTKISYLFAEMMMDFQTTFVSDKH